MSGPVAMEQIGLRLTGDASGLKAVLQDGGRAVNDFSTRAASDMGKVATNAKQVEWATRNLPAQFTDIVTSLQAGQQPMTVLLQQGGQLKDMFGGVGPAARAMGSYIAGLANPLTIGAGAIIALSYAAAQGGQELRSFQNAAALSGNTIGLSTSNYTALRDRLVEVAGTKGRASEALIAIAAAGGIAGKNIQVISEAAVLMERAAVQSVKKTAEQFAELGREPVEASKKLNEQYNYLTASIYAQIKALDESGQKQKAADVAERAYADAMATRAKGVIENVTLMEKAWRGLAGMAKSAWDAMLNPGREESIEERFRKVSAQVARGQAPFDPSAFGGNAEARAKLEANRSEMQSLFRLSEIEQRNTDATNASTAANRAAVVAIDYLTKANEQNASKQEQMNKALREYRQHLDALRSAPNANSPEVQQLLDPKTIAATEAGIRKRFADTSGESNIAQVRANARIAAEEVDRLKKAIDTLDFSQPTKLTDAEKRVILVQEQLKLGLQGVARANKEKELAEAQAAVQGDKNLQQLTHTYELVKQLRTGYLQYVQQVGQEAQSINDQAAQQEAANATYGKGKTAIEALTLARLKLQAAEAADTTDGYLVAINAKVAAQERYVKALQDGEAVQLRAKQTEDGRVVDEEAKTIALEYQLLNASKDVRDQILAQRAAEVKLAKELAEIEKSNATPEEKEKLSVQARAIAAQDAANRANKAVLDEWQRTSDKISDQLTDALMRGFENGKDAAENFRDTLKNMFRTLVLQPIIRAIVQPVAASLSGVMLGGGGYGGIAGGGYGNAVMNNYGLIGAGYQYLTGASAGASTASLAYANGVGALGGDSIGALIAANGGWAGVGGAALGSTAGTTAGAYGLGTLGTGGVGYGATLGGSIMGGATGTTSVAAGSVVAGSTAGGTAAGTAAGGTAAGAAAGASWIPVVGWIVAAAALLYAVFGNKGGGPKVDGVYGTLGSGIGQGRRSTETDGAAAQAAQGLQNQFDSIVKTYGGNSNGLKFGLGYSMDPAGSSPSFLDITASRNGQTDFSYLNRGVGRSQEELQAAIGAMGARAMLKGLQESNLVGLVGDYMRQLGDIDKLSDGAITASIAKVQKALTEKQTLEDQYWALTHTDEEVLQRNRLREVSALDESNRAMALRIQALQDEKAMQEKIFAVTSNIKAYLDKLDGSPSGMLPPEVQLENARTQYNAQLEKARAGDPTAMQNITGYADQLAQAQTAYTASGQPTQDTLNYIRQTLNSLPGTITNPGTGGTGGAGAEAAGWGWFPEMNAGMTAPIWHYGPIAELITKYTGFANGQPSAFNGGNATPTTYQPPAGTVSPEGFKYLGNGVTGLAQFADGAAFTNSLVMRPTMFRMPGGDLGQMGERSTEAVMPLANIGGKLGVHAANDPAVRAELRGIREELRNVAVLVAAAGRATADGVDEVARNTAGLQNQALLQKISVAGT